MAISREFSRVQIELGVSIDAGSTHIGPDHTRDLSMNGVFVVGEPALPQGRDCDVALHIDGRPMSECVRVAGRVARVTPDGYAIEFLGVGRESCEHLRKLVRYHVTDQAPVHAASRIRSASCGRSHRHQATEKGLSSWT